ncbi:MAG TPA: hypothetical protein VHD32_11870 [Candidatus Didemnitutus sp.]|nr:hypothetical protein [Candidatus Didemnitutus sp.]
MRTVRLCAIIALGMALGYAFENAPSLSDDLSAAATTMSAR